MQVCGFVHVAEGGGGWKSGCGEGGVRGVEVGGEEGYLGEGEG